MSSFRPEVEVRSQVEVTAKKLRDYGTRVTAATERALFKGALLVQKKARELVLKGPKTGNQYGTLRDIKKVNFKLRGHKAAAKRVHQASAPGEAPANDTGNLARNIKVVRIARTKNARPAVGIRAGTKYAAALEFGTRKAGRSKNVIIEARPFLQPAIRACNPEIQGLIRKEVRALDLAKKKKPPKTDGAK